MSYWRLFTACLSLGLGMAMPMVLSAKDLDKPNWPQFRGPDGSGVAENGRIPLQFGPTENLLWRAELPPGHSSPCVWGNRIFLTGFDAETKTLKMICLRRSDGSQLWEQDAPAKEIEKVHRTSSPASATPVADTERVYFYFGSCGLICLSHEGEEVWHHDLPLAQKFNGSGTSPALAGNLLLINREGKGEHFLLALDRESGEIVWKAQHPNTSPQDMGHGGEATPLVCGGIVVVHRSGQVVAYNLADGQLQWTVSVSTTGCASPVLAEDAVYVAAWNNFGEEDQMVELPSFNELKEKYDADEDGLIDRDELPEDFAITQRPELDKNLGGNIGIGLVFSSIDIGKDNAISRLEWWGSRLIFKQIVKSMKHGLVAIRLGGSGDVSKSHLLWRAEKNVPEVPSPLVHDGRLYALRNGGVLSCFAADSGELLYRKRLGAGGGYFSSPLAVDGKILAASGEGVITLIQAGDEFQVLAKNDLGEPIFATPAVVEDTLYVRTLEGMYAFSQP